MTLVELFPYCLSPEKRQALCRQQGVSEEAIEDEEIAIYMENERSLEAPIHLFDSTVSDDCLRFQHQGIEYVHFLALDEVADFLRETDEGTDLAKAQRLLHYSIYDA
ncbi:hypothetical protein ACW9KT_21915 [Hymenobacter sp. HD11105]